MPELPEVEVTRLGLLAHVRGVRITKTTVKRGDFRLPLPDHFAKKSHDYHIADIDRRAKYLLFHLHHETQKPLVMLVHLGMSGSMRLCSADTNLRKHDHIIWHLGANKQVKAQKQAKGQNQQIGQNSQIDQQTQIVPQMQADQQIRFHDPRRFGLVLLLNPAEIKTHKLLCNLGPEPLSPQFNARYLRQKLYARKTPIKTAIMDGTLVVGVGNIYASESLFLCGIHPQMPACDVAGKSAQLIRAIRKTLRAAIAAGGSSLHDYVNTQGDTGYFQHAFKVYGRAQSPCFACEMPIKHAVQAGRATYWCEGCQPFRV
jgi:formamidopyrimidine-DNA glycosylase